MGRKSTGTVRLLKNEQGRPQWHARWTRADGSRTEYLPLDPRIAPSDEAGARALAARMAEKVRTAGTTGSGAEVETVAAYAERWLNDRQGRVKSLRSDRARMRDHVLPILGSLDVRAFTRDDAEHLRDAIDRRIEAGELSWKTGANVWTVVTSMCADMVSAKKRAFRVRDDNPCRDVKAPERGARKAKQYLYPSEFLQFVSCEAVPLRWRRAVALAVYTFTRDGELRALRWDGGDVDLQHGLLSITRAYNQNTKKVEQTKTGETRRFSVEATLRPLLDALHEESNGIGPVLSLAPQGNMARTLRTFLQRAGVTRPELHEATATRKPMTWHDLRATGITWMAVRGDDPLKIKQRAGHTTFQTTDGYIREAEAIREGFGEPFPPLPPGLLGRENIAPQSPRAIKRAQTSQKRVVFVPKEGLEPSRP